MLTTTATDVGAPGAAIFTAALDVDAEVTELVAVTTKVYVPPGVKPDTAHVNVAPANTVAHGVNDCPAAEFDPVAATE